MLVAMFETRRIVRGQEGFPAKLADLPAWPGELQLHGTLRCDGIGVAIVGARAATAEGMRSAHDLAAELARSGHRIISGGALGIDAAAHRGAISVGGYTVAVMACGLDQYYPKRNARLFTTLLHAGGAMLSPFAWGDEPLRSHFVRRNQVIAALADVVVVVEASTASGSLHTARFAAKLTRPLAAFPGSPGCEALLANGIPRVTCAADVVDLVAGVRRTTEVALPAADSPEALVLARLSASRAQAVAQVAEAVGLPLRQTQRILLRLELQSLVVLRPGRRYLRSALS